MKALVCGGRDFSDYNWMEEVLSSFENFKGEKITQIIHGGARGADSLAGRWAVAKAIPVEVFPADWNTHGKHAGPIRNSQMLIEGKPNIVIAFPGGRGTANMILQAKRAGVSVVKIHD